MLKQSTFNKKNKDRFNDDNDDNHVQDVLASNYHQLLVPKGMNCTPRYQVDYAYAQGMLIMQIQPTDSCSILPSSAHTINIQQKERRPFQ